jgi:hypothetical protein
MSSDKKEGDTPLQPDYTWWYVGIGVGVFCMLCISVVVILFLSGGAKNSSETESHFPSYIVLEHRYGPGVNPHDNLSVPPLPPPKPDVFGT